MAESPRFYMPDFKAQWGLVNSTNWKTEEITYRSGRRQRRSQWATQLRQYKLSNAHVMMQDDRRALYDFFNARKGMKESFYFWETSPRTIRNAVPATVFGTTYGLDTKHQPFPWKGAFWKGDDDVEPTYATKNGVQYIGSGNTYYSIKDSACLIPRGNSYCALSFNGSTTYADAGTAVSTRIAGDQTWMAWVFPRPADAGSTSWPIAHNITGSASGARFFLDSSRRVTFTTAQSGVTTEASSGSSVPLNKWTHVCVVKNATSVLLYINGVLDTTGGALLNPTTATATFQIGTMPTSVFFHGMIQDLRVANSALSLTDIKAIYTDAGVYETLGLFDLNVSWWPIQDGRGSITLLGSFNASLVGYGADSWVGGEDEVALNSTLTGQPKVGLVSGARQRVVVTFGMDELPESFLADVADLRAQFDVSLIEARD